MGEIVIRKDRADSEAESISEKAEREDSGVECCEHPF